MEGLTPKRMRRAAWMILAEAEDISLDSLESSKAALSKVEMLREELELWEACAKRAIKAHEKEERTRWR